MNQDSARPVVGARPLEENQSEGENSWPGEVAHESVCVQDCMLYLCFSKQCLLIYSQVQNKALKWQDRGIGRTASEGVGWVETRRERVISEDHRQVGCDMELKHRVLV